MTVTRKSLVLPVALAALAVAGCKSSASKPAPAPAPVPAAAVAPAADAPAPAVPGELGISRLRAANDFYTTLMLYQTDLKERDLDKCKRHTAELVRTVTVLGAVRVGWLTEAQRATFEAERAQLPPLVRDMEDALAMNRLPYAQAVLEKLLARYAQVEAALR